MTTLHEWVAYLPLVYIVPAALVFSMRSWGALSLTVVLAGLLGRFLASGSSE